MKLKSILSFCFLLSFIGISYAQQGQGGQQMSSEERAKSAVEKIKPALTLTDDQEKSTLEVFTDYYKNFEKLREQMRSGNRPDPSVMQGMTDERDVKLKKIFTKDQYKKFKNEVEQTLRGQRGQGGPGGSGGRGNNPARD